ncbi:hypothetical protein FEF26_15305 [Nesterenkonia salmonea]|uniref:Uncharacterized protein n=1 Tax=Nesterenkonia salmonea TaxID=1804987 RepID=A0A5R9B4F6_9MICC|nr:hypothetical protein [Nesterenkonia salmonea]TLP90509.1 hypothetical protein FEF26_15305 [Nesterenkonia salmonea]
MGQRETITTIALLLGPAVAGTLMGFFGGTTVLWITAGTSLAAGLMTFMLSAVVGRSATTEGQVQKLEGTGWCQLRDGWGVLLKSRFLVGMTLLMARSTPPTVHLRDLLNIGRIPEATRGGILGTENAITPAVAVAVAGVAVAAVMVKFMNLEVVALIFVSLWVIFVVYGLFGSAFRTLEKPTTEEV